MRFLLCYPLLASLLFGSAAKAEAHFIWLGVPADKADSTVLVYFGETAEPGSPHLLDKIAHTKAWARNTDGSTQDLTVKKPADEKTGGLVTDCPGQAACVEATCDYGVYSHGGPGFLLQYYAKHLSNDWATRDAKLTRSDRLVLDVVPKLADGRITMTVLYQGKPVADKEVVVLNPSGKQFDLKTDNSGNIAIDAAAGNYAVRAAYVEADKSGKRDEKSYSQIWHYCTLTFAAPSTPAPKPISDPDAVAALARARAGRALWKGFPGFTADLVVTSAGEPVVGKVSVDENGVVSLDMPKSSLASWVQEQLDSMVQHRMPDGEVAEGAITWAEKDASHPLGRKIDLGDPTLKSAYRLKDDAIMEVNRMMGDLRFTISVLEIFRNQEGKYLPRSFTMNFFDSKTGELKVNLAFLNEWQRVGAFDLPKTILEIDGRDGKSVTKQIQFTNMKLANSER
jgi:uncharacterized GH25 family protein